MDLHICFFNFSHLDTFLRIPINSILCNQMGPKCQSCNYYMGHKCLWSFTIRECSQGKSLRNFDSCQILFVLSITLVSSNYKLLLFLWSFSRDGNGSGLNGDPHWPTPIRGGFCRFGAGLGFYYYFTRVGFRATLDFGWAWSTAPQLFYIDVFLPKLHVQSFCRRTSSK